MADAGPNGRLMINGRRHIGVGEDRVIVSRLAHADVAGIGIGTPKRWLKVYCAPCGDDEHMSPIDRDGWLDLSALTSWHEYWLELQMFGGVSVERSDSDGTRYRWYWPLPTDLWRRIQCG